MADAAKKIYWVGALSYDDDFGVPYEDEMFDAPTRQGPWANMTRASWLEHRATDKLGSGHGQRYVREGRRWLKVEG